jgi:hypothetical protein
MGTTGKPSPHPPVILCPPLPRGGLFVCRSTSVAFARRKTVVMILTNIRLIVPEVSV